MAMYTFRKFSWATVTQGLYHVLNVIHRTKGGKRFWPFIICLSMIFCLWQTYLSVQLYLSYNTGITVDYEFANQLKFPAITILNQNSLRRTVIGRRQLRMRVAMMNGGGSNAGFQKLYYQINKTCYYEPPLYDQIEELISSVDIAALKTLDFAMINKNMSFFKCYYRNIEEDCESIALTTMMDESQGFSFNVDLDVAQNFLGNESGLGQLNKKYTGSSAMSYFKSTGAENGLKLILNVNQDEYCLYSQYTWFGTGFYLILHDSNTIPSDWFETSLSLSPGYRFDVAIKPTQHHRNTAHLGVCVSYYSLYMFPESVGYSKENCLIQCENEYVWQHCGCLSTQLRKASVAFARMHHLDEKMPLACIVGNQTCLSELRAQVANDGIENYCPQCKQPCKETEYNFQVTLTKFPPNHLVQYYLKELNATDEIAIKNNFLVVNIYFESTLVQVVTEYQTPSLRDTFIAIGNTVILFLGMSFMSFGEILLFFLKAIVFIVKFVVKFIIKAIAAQSKTKTIKTSKTMRKTRIKTVRVQRIK